MRDQEITEGSIYGPKYPKINSLYKRDCLNKIMVGNYVDPVFEMLSGIMWSCTEKVDGMNIRVHWDGENLNFCGRTDKSMLPAIMVTKLNSLFTKQKMMAEVGIAPMTLYGEGFGEGIQSGGSYRIGAVDFILFDILVDGTYWLPRAEMMHMASRLGLAVVPLLMTDTLPNCVDMVRDGFPSSIAERPRPAEGLVLKPMVGLRDMKGERIITKLKTKDFA